MKKFTCKDMNGPCDHEMMAATLEESIDVGMAHMKEAHPDMAKDIESMPKDDPKMMEWSKMWTEKFATLPDAA